MDTTGLKSTAIAGNPIAQGYFPARTACATTRRPEVHTTMDNNTWCLATGSCRMARSNMVMNTHFMVFVILGNLSFVPLIQTLRTKLGFTDESGFLFRCTLVLFLFHLPRQLFLQRLQFV
jgi:hypothetical protein